MYLLIKGCNGFGNMMSVLSLAYEIVKNNKHLTLVIDWTHKEWILGFDRYFRLDHVKYMKYEDSLNMPTHQLSEVSMMEWKPFDNAITSIRTYNKEKINILHNVNTLITKSFAL